MISREAERKRGSLTYVAAEIEPQGQTASVEATPETTAQNVSAHPPTVLGRVYSPLVRELPLSVDDSEGDIFVWRTSAEVQQYGLIVPGLLDDLVRGRL